MWLPATPGWGSLVWVGVGPSPILAVVRRFEGCGPSLPAEGHRWAFPRHSRLRAPGAVPRHSWLGARWFWWWVALRHSWLRVLGAVPRHSWLGSAGCGGGRVCGVWWGPSVCLWHGACWCVCCVFVVVVWVLVCLPCVLVCVLRVAVGFPGLGLLLV